MGRSLTQGEIKLAKAVFKESIAYDLVEIHNDSYVFFQPDNSGMTPNGEIYMNGIYEEDYSIASSDLQALFIHEMVHVWQYQNSLFLSVKLASIWEFITEGFDYDQAYDYTLDSFKDLTEYDIEQQAMIIEDYVRITKFKLLPSRNLKNKEIGAELLFKYKNVLGAFLQNPSYVRHRRASRVEGNNPTPTTKAPGAPNKEQPAGTHMTQSGRILYR